MTATAEPLLVRVAVTDNWEQVVLTLGPAETIADLKRRALARTVGRAAVPDDYVVKYRGALVLDEAVTAAVLGVPPNAPFVVLPARRRPVR